MRRGRRVSGDRGAAAVDHATIARFVERHQDALAGLFAEVLTQCARSGLAKVGVIAVDGTKVHATGRVRWRVHARTSAAPRDASRRSGGRLVERVSGPLIV